VELHLVRRLRGHGDVPHAGVDQPVVEQVAHDRADCGNPEGVAHRVPSRVRPRYSSSDMRGPGFGFLRGSGDSSALTARTSIRPMVTRTVGSPARLVGVGNEGLTARLGSGAARVGRAGGVTPIGISAGTGACFEGGAARSVPLSATGGAAVG